MIDDNDTDEMPPAMPNFQDGHMVHQRAITHVAHQRAIKGYFTVSLGGARGQRQLWFHCNGFDTLIESYPDSHEAESLRNRIAFAFATVMDDMYPDIDAEPSNET